MSATAADGFFMESHLRLGGCGVIWRWVKPPIPSVVTSLYRPPGTRVSRLGTPSSLDATSRSRDRMFLFGLFFEKKITVT